MNIVASPYEIWYIRLQQHELRQYPGCTIIVQTSGGTVSDHSIVPGKILLQCLVGELEIALSIMHEFF